MTGLVESHDLRLAFPIIFRSMVKRCTTTIMGTRWAPGKWPSTTPASNPPLHYASDITRTIPIGGRFVGPQRDLYETVLRAHKKRARGDEARRQVQGGPPAGVPDPGRPIQKPSGA